MCAAADAERGSTKHFGGHKGGEFAIDGTIWREKPYGGEAEDANKFRKIDSSLRAGRAVRFLLIERTAFISDCYFKCPKEKRLETRSQKKS